jgi:hypothetical protein
VVFEIAFVVVIDVVVIADLFNLVMYVHIIHHHHAPPSMYENHITHHLHINVHVDVVL